MAARDVDAGKAAGDGGRGFAAAQSKRGCRQVQKRAALHQ
jgi:hypothetical protein